jgi:hypothetical protein
MSILKAKPASWFGRYASALLSVFLVSCGGDAGSEASGPVIREKVALHVRSTDAAGRPCHGYRVVVSDVGVSQSRRFCGPFNDQHLAVIAISGGHSFPRKTLIGVMPHLSTSFVVGMSDGTTVRSSSDEEGFFALDIGSSAEIGSVRLQPTGQQEIVCGPIDFDFIPCH